MDAVVEGVTSLRGVRAPGVLLLGPEPLADRPVLHGAPEPPPAPGMLACSDRYGVLFAASQQGA